MLEGQDVLLEKKMAALKPGQEHSCWKVTRALLLESEVPQQYFVAGPMYIRWSPEYMEQVMALDIINLLSLLP